MHLADKWLGKGFAMDFLAMFDIHGHFDCFLGSRKFRQVKQRMGDLKSSHPFILYKGFHFPLFSKRFEHLGDALFLLFHVRMDIEVECRGDVGMTEQHADSLVVAVALYAASGETVA